MLARLIHAALVLCWVAVMAAISIREREHRAAPSYSAELGRVFDPERSRYAILQSGKRIGEATSAVVPLDSGTYRIETRCAGSFSLLGRALSAEITMRTDVDPSRGPSQLSFDLRSPPATDDPPADAPPSSVFRIHATGFRDGDDFALRISGSLGSTDVRIPLGGDPNLRIELGIGLLQSVPPGARPGDRWSFPLLSPLTGSIDRAEVRVVGEREVDGRRRRDLEIVAAGFTTRAEVDDAGRLLREDTPFGLSIVRDEDAAEESRR